MEGVPEYEVKRMKNIEERKKEFSKRKLDENPLLVSQKGDEALQKNSKKGPQKIQKIPTRVVPKQGLVAENISTSPAVGFY